MSLADDFMAAINQDRMVSLDKFEAMMAPIRAAYNEGRDKDIKLFHIIDLVQKSGIPMSMDDFLIHLIVTDSAKNVALAVDLLFPILIKDTENKFRNEIVKELSKWNMSPGSSQAFIDYLNTIKSLV